jgi:hypothetical protein
VDGGVVLTPCKAVQYTVALGAPNTVTISCTDLRDTAATLTVRLKSAGELVGKTVGTVEGWGVGRTVEGCVVGWRVGLFDEA